MCRVLPAREAEPRESFDFRERKVRLERLSGFDIDPDHFFRQLHIRHAPGHSREARSLFFGGYQKIGDRKGGKHARPVQRFVRRSKRVERRMRPPSFTVDVDGEDRQLLHVQFHADEYRVARRDGVPFRDIFSDSDQYAGERFQRTQPAALQRIEESPVIRGQSQPGDHGYPILGLEMHL